MSLIDRSKFKNENHGDLSHNLSLTDHYKFIFLGRAVRYHRDKCWRPFMGKKNDIKSWKVEKLEESKNNQAFKKIMVAISVRDS